MEHGKRYDDVRNFNSFLHLTMLVNPFNALIMNNVLIKSLESRGGSNHDLSVYITHLSGRIIRICQIRFELQYS